MSGAGREIVGLIIAALGVAALEVGTAMLNSWVALLLVNGPILIAIGFVLMRHDRDQGEPER